MWPRFLKVSEIAKDYGTSPCEIRRMLGLPKDSEEVDSSRAFGYLADAAAFKKRQSRSAEAFKKRIEVDRIAMAKQAAERSGRRVFIERDEAGRVTGAVIAETPT